VRRERGARKRASEEAELGKKRNLEPLRRASVTDHSQDHQVRHVNQQVDGCQDGHNQSLVPDAHVGSALINAAQLVGPLGLPTEPRIELVERPEDQSSGVEEDGEHRLPKPQTGVGQTLVTVTPVPQHSHSPQDEADAIHGHTPHQGWLVLIRVGVAEEGEDDTCHEDLQPLEQA